MAFVQRLGDRSGEKNGIKFASQASFEVQLRHLYCKPSDQFYSTFFWICVFDERKAYAKHHAGAGTTDNINFVSFEETHVLKPCPFVSYWLQHVETYKSFCPVSVCWAIPSCQAVAAQSAFKSTQLRKWLRVTETHKSNDT